ncbi:MAG: hypothetical protein QW756_03825 [Nitrososphaerota archaeon]
MSRLWTILLVMTLLLLPLVGGQQITAPERVIRVTENGLLQITDVLNVGPAATQVRVGFTSDMYRRLAAYYVEGVDAAVTVSPVENNVFFLVINMPEGWAGGSFRLVSIWRGVLLRVGDQYEVIMAVNPLLEEAAGTMNVRLEVPQGAEIKSIQGVEMTMHNKTLAQGIIPVEGGLRFRSMRAVIDAPALIFVSFERASLTVKAEEGRVQLALKLRNNGDNPLAELSINLGLTAEVEAVRVGFEGLRYSRSGETLTVIFDRPLGKGEAIEFTITYRDESLVRVEAGRLTVRPPKIYENTINEYVVTVVTPPASSLSFDNLEPWRVQPGDSMSTSVTFKLSNFYPTPSYMISFSYTSATFFNPVPALIAALLISGAAAVAGPRLRRAGAKPRAFLPPDVKESISRAISIWSDMALGIDEVLGDFNPASRKGIASTKVEETLKNVRRVRDIMGEAIRRHGETPQEVVSKVDLYVKNLAELSDAMQALARSAEDYRAKRLSRRVYERVYREYVRTVGELVGEVNGLADELRRFT